MDWERTPNPPQPRGRLGGVVAIVAVVALGGWLARSPATTPEELTGFGPSGPVDTISRWTPEQPGISTD